MPGVVGGPGGLDLGQVAVRPGDQLAEQVHPGEARGKGGLTGLMVDADIGASLIDYRYYRES